MTTVAQFVAQLVADTSRFQDGLRDAERSTKRFAGELTQAFAGVKFVDEGALRQNAAKIADGLTAGIRAGFDRDMTTLREQMIRELVSPADFARGGREAGRAMNRAILAQMDELRNAGRLTEPLRQELVSRLRDIGHDAGDAMVDSMRPAFARMRAHALQDIGGSLQAVGVGLSATITAPIVLAVTESIRQASAAIESENLFNVALGDMAASARAFSEELSSALELDPTVTRRNIATFSAMFKSMGFTAQGAATMSQSLTQLSNDLSSFYNLSQEDAFAKLQSGISGEVEPLRRLGITVDEHTVKQYALANGIAKGTGELTQQQKMLARYGVILAQTTLAQGDLARTLDSPTNAMRALQNQVGALAKELGAAILPMAVPFLAVGRSIVAFARSVVDSFRTLHPSIQTFIVGIVGLAAAMGPLILVAGQVALALGALALASTAFGVALGPILGIGAVLAVAGIALISFRKEIAAVATTVYQFLKPAFDFITRVFVVGVGGAVLLLGKILGGIGTLFAGAGQAIARGFERQFGESIRFVIQWGGRFVDFVGGILARVVWVIQQAPLYRALAAGFEAALTFVTNLATRFLAAGRDVVNAIIQGVADAARALPGVGARMAGYIETLLLTDKEAIASAAGAKVGAAYVKSAETTVARAKTIALPKFALPNLGFLDPNALGGATGGAKGKTALQLIAEQARDAIESMRGLREANMVTVAVAQQMVGVYDRVLATVQQIGPSTAKGASDLRNALGDLSRDPTIQFFRTGGKVLDFAVRLTTLGQDARSLEQSVRTSLLRVSGGFGATLATGIHAPVYNETERAVQEALRSAIAKSANLPGLVVAPQIQAEVDTSGVSGGLRAMALGLSRTGAHVRAFADSTMVMAPFANIIRATADGFDALSGAVSDLSAAFADPVATIKTLLGGFGAAIELTSRGLVAAAKGIVTSVVGALNPLNVFRAFAERIGQALSPALDALEGPIAQLASVVADGLTPVFRALQPVVDALVPVIRELFNVIGPILVALAPVLRVIAILLQAIMPVIRLMAIAFTYVGQVVFTVAGALSRFFGNLVIGFGKIVETIARAIDKLPGISAKGAIRFAEDIQKMGSGMLAISDEFRDGAKALGDARDQIRAGNYMELADGSAAAANGLNDVANTARQVTAALRNVPEGFRVARERFYAQAPAGYPGAGPFPQNPPGAARPPIGAGPYIPTAPLTVTGPVYIMADSETTAARVVDDLIGEARRQAATAGQPAQWTAMLPSVARAARRGGAL